MIIKPIKKYNKTLTVPGDKSITHRAVMFGALAKGTTVIKGALLGADCLSTIDCMRKLGAEIKVDGNTVTVVGIKRKENKEIIKLDVGNSGTTIRLLAGALAGIEGLNVELSGDESIVRRPMKRVVEPLRLMGADIECKGGEGLAPIVIRGKRLKEIDYVMPVASAQVKSAILLAGLNADGETVVREKVVSRNHTEIMLRMFGCEVKESKEKGRENVVRVRRSTLRAVDVGVPADISSAAFAAVLAAVKGKVVLKNVGVNPTRTGILDMLEAVGASVVRTPTETTRPTEHHCHCEEFTTKQSHVKCSICGIVEPALSLPNGSALPSRNDAANPLFAQEPIADITIQTSKLKPFVIEGDIIPRLIDEIPVLAVLA